MDTNNTNYITHKLISKTPNVLFAGKNSYVIDNYTDITINKLNELPNCVLLELNKLLIRIKNNMIQDGTYMTVKNF